MRKVVLVTGLLLLAVGGARAGSSVIVEADGSACMGDDRSRKETERQAEKDASRRAAEQAGTYIRSESLVKDLVLEKDLVSAYANAQVKILRELEKGWYRDTVAGECCRVRIQAEVLPDVKALEGIAKRLPEDDPAAPLSVRIWTDRAEYVEGEKIRIYLRGNKPFYARVVYRDASGSLVQLLPNPYRSGSHFQGGTVYDLPSAEDRFDLEVSSPFGGESVAVYASTSPVGELDVAPAGGVFAVKTRPGDVAASTRGIRITGREAGKGKPAGAEFSETRVDVKTRGKTTP